MKRLEEGHFISPAFLLGIGFVGILLTLGVLIIEPVFSLMGYLGIFLSVSSLLVWLILYRRSVKAALFSKASPFALWTLLITAAIILTMFLSYLAIRQQDWRFDLSRSSNFSLVEASQSIIEAYADDPNMPPVEIIVFSGSQQLAEQDRLTILLDDYVNFSKGKITYRFVNADREPHYAIQYGIQNGDTLILPYDENGQAQAANAEIILAPTQEEITNAIIRVSTDADFYAFFANVTDGLLLDSEEALGMSQLRDALDQIGWTSESISLFNLVNQDLSIQDLAAQADGSILILPGGSQPLPADQLDIIRKYLAQGGALMILAGANLDGDVSLATDPAFNAYLEGEFGIRIPNNLVIDPNASIQGVFNQLIVNYSDSHFITQFLAPGQDSLLFQLSHSLEIAPRVPDDVQIETLAFSGASSYSKPSPDFSQELGAEQLSYVEGDAGGPFPLAFAVLNRTSGAKLVVFGSDSLATNEAATLSNANIRNLDVTLRAMVWASNFSEYYNNLPQVSIASRDTGQALLLTTQQLSLINFILVILLPALIFGLGLWVWWRERQRAEGKGN
ncbi:hypothetical protein MASR2M15_02690 [Anaerolineales bacterium]